MGFFLFKCYAFNDLVSLSTHNSVQDGWAEIDLDSGVFLMVISAESVPLAGSSAGLMIVSDGREKELQCR